MDKTLDDFLDGKPEHVTGLFYHFIKEYKSLGEVTIHPTKSMIVISGKTRIAYIIQIAQKFIDIVFPFKEAFTDNLCFVKIKRVPGTNDYNHHFRMYLKEDINDEIKYYMKLSLENSLN